MLYHLTTLYLTDIAQTSWQCSSWLTLTMLQLPDKMLYLADKALSSWQCSIWLTMLKLADMLYLADNAPSG